MRFSTLFISVLLLVSPSVPQESTKKHALDTATTINTNAMTNSILYSLSFGVSDEMPTTESTIEPDTRDDASSSSEMSYSCRAYRFAFSVGVTGSICVLGCFGNALSLAVLSKFDGSDSKSSTGFLLSALAICDMMVLLTLIIMKSIPSFCTFTGTFQEYFIVYPYLLVYGWPFSDLVHAYSSWLTVLVAIHRYIAVCKPHKARILCNKKQGVKQVVMLMIAVTTFQIPFFLDFYPARETAEDGSTILVRRYTSLALNKTYQMVYKTTIYYIVMYALPLVLLMWFTFHLINALSQATKQRAQMTGLYCRIKQD